MDLLNCLRANCQFDTVNAKKFLLKLASHQDTKKANRKEAKKNIWLFYYILVL